MLNFLLFKICQSLILEFAYFTKPLSFNLVFSAPESQAPIKKEPAISAMKKTYAKTSIAVIIEINELGSKKSYK
jgi:hypothetical protein